MKYNKDGDHLCIINDDFINLQESDAVFIEYESQLARDLMKLIDNEQIKFECKACFSDNLKIIDTEVELYCNDCGYKYFQYIKKVIKK